MKLILNLKFVSIFIFFSYILENSLKCDSKSFMKPNKNRHNNSLNQSVLNLSSNTKNVSSNNNSTQIPLKNSTNNTDIPIIPYFSTFEKRVQENNITKTFKLLNANNSKTENSSSKITENNINGIISYTDKIKTEICDSSKLVNTSLFQLDDQITEIKNDLKNLTEKDVNDNEMVVKFTVCINNVNLIKADLIKINDILETLKKANCKNYDDTQKKFDSTTNLVNTLVTNIQNFIRTKNMNINLVILS